MRFITIFLVALCLIPAALQAEVIPVVYDKPLALRPDPGISHSSPMSEYHRALDDWLNVRINSDNSGQVQNEQQVVVNPTNLSNVVAVWRDFRLGYRRVGVGYSFDGGWNWTDDLFVEPTYPWQSDPGLTWHTSGAIYAVVISYDPSGEDGLFVAQSTDGGVNWGPFIPAVHGVPDSFEDKELIACDRSGSQYDGNLYVAWTKFAASTGIHVVRSTTQGQSWDDPVLISDNSGVQWPVPAVGPNGEVYVAWVKYYTESIRFDKSLDGGLTWGDDVIVQPTSFASASINPDLLIFAFPAMDVDITEGTNRGNIYIAYTDDWYGDTDIFFTGSRNGGLNWSSPIRVNDDDVGNGADQFHPWLVCDENGTLHLIFYDRRNDVPQNLYMDLYYTYSVDAGMTWSPNERITEVSSNPAHDSLDSGLIGEYNGLAVAGGVIHPVWTDTRDLNQDTYTAVWDTSASAPGLIQHPLAGTQVGGLLDAAPNPFNGTIEICVRIPEPGWMGLTVYDLAGRKVATLAAGEFAPGTIRRIWKPVGPTGVYLIRVVSASGSEVRKVLYLK